MKRGAHSKAVLDDSWITVNTTSLHQHKLYYCTITLICHVVKVNNKSCVIQGPDQDLAYTHQRLRDSMSGRAVQVSDKTKNKPRAKQKPLRPTATRLKKKQINPVQRKNRARSQAVRLINRKPSVEKVKKS